MLRQLTLDEVKKYIVDDTVRPHLSAEFRTTGNRQVWGFFLLIDIRTAPISASWKRFCAFIPPCWTKAELARPFFLPK